MGPNSFLGLVNHQFWKIFYGKLKKLSKQLFAFSFFYKNFLKWFTNIYPKHTLVNPFFLGSVWNLLILLKNSTIRLMNSIKKYNEVYK